MFAKSRTSVCRGRSRRAVDLATVVTTLLLIFGCVPQTTADSIALSFTGGTFANAGGFNLGWVFSVNSPILVTEIGIWDQDGNGLAIDHGVSLYYTTGITFQPIGGAVIPQGTNAPLIDGFRYIALSTPIPIEPQRNYFIFSPYGDASDPFITGATSVTTVSPVVYRGSFSGDSSPNSYFGPNFQFISVSVPETSSTSFLLCLGLAGIFSLKAIIGGRQRACGRSRR